MHINPGVVNQWGHSLAKWPSNEALGTKESNRKENQRQPMWTLPCVR